VHQCTRCRITLPSSKLLVWILPRRTLGLSTDSRVWSAPCTISTCSEHRERVAKIDKEKLSKQALGDRVVAEEALKHTKEREDKQMALAKQMQENRVAAEHKHHEESVRMRAVEQEAKAEKRTVVQEKLSKRNEFLIEKRKAEARCKSLIVETGKIEAELELEEARRRQATDQAEKDAASAKAAERRRIIATMKVAARLSTPMRTANKVTSDASRHEPEAMAQAVHFSDVKVRQSIVGTEARRIHAIRAKLNAASVIQRAWRLYAARRDHGELPARPRPRTARQTRGLGMPARDRKAATEYHVAGDVRSGVATKSLHMTLAAPTLPPLRMRTGTNKLAASRNKKTGKMHRIKFPDLLSPEATIADAKHASSGLHVEVAALLIQLWWRRHKSRMQLEKRRLLQTGPGSEAVAALAEQRKNLVNIYAPREPLMRVSYPPLRKSSTAQLNGARHSSSSSFSSSLHSSPSNTSRTTGLRRTSSLPFERIAAPYRQMYATTLGTRPRGRGARKLNSQVRLESLRPSEFL
jgi:hypothetical protein